MNQKDEIENKILNCIKENVNSEGFTDITATDISKKVFYSRTYVINFLKKLEKKGVIVWLHLEGMRGTRKRIYLLKQDQQ